MPSPVKPGDPEAVCSACLWWEAKDGDDQAPEPRGVCHVDPPRAPQPRAWCAASEYCSRWEPTRSTT